MEKVLYNKELISPSFIQRVFHLVPKQNAVIEINNLLSENEILTIDIEQIHIITNKYKVQLKKRFEAETIEFYKHYLRHFLQDHLLEDIEIKKLKHLKHLLELNDTVIDQVHDELIREIYQTEVDKVVEDGRLDEEEKEYLEKLQKNLKIPKTLADSIYQQRAEKLLQKFLDKAIEDQRLSPEEDGELHAIARSLGVTLSIDENTMAILNKMKLFWVIENGDIPQIDVQINLQKNEKCYFYSDIDWYEQRRVTRRVNYGGPSLRIKIAKGVYWRTGSLGVQRISEDVMKLIDRGRMFLTSKRLIFMGDLGNKTIRLNKILDFNAYSNGVEILKETGKSPFLEFVNNNDIFCMILGRAIQDYK